MKTVYQALTFLTKSFRDNRIELPECQAENLLGNLLSYSRQELYLNRTQMLTEKQWECCQDWMYKRLLGVPLQYLHGQTEFFDCLIKVNPNVLIPRQETEILVDKIVGFLKTEDLNNKVLWDLCCGSGCIGIAVKKRFPALQVIASDLSAEAVETAKKNAEENRVEMTIRQGDLFEAFADRKVHYFVCNPPYISLKDYNNLEKEVLNNEPRQALLAGESGLEFYERLARGLPRYLYASSEIWLEIGHNQGEALMRLFGGPRWENQKVEKDWSGHDRFFSCRLK